MAFLGVVSVAASGSCSIQTAASRKCNQAKPVNSFLAGKTVTRKVPFWGANVPGVHVSSSETRFEINNQSLETVEAPLKFPVRPVGAKPDCQLDMRRRPRRNRKSPQVRGLYRETSVSPANFILPLFIHDGSDEQPISAMPGCYRLSRAGLLREVQGAINDGVKTVVLFPKVPDELKTSDGRECFNPSGIVPRTVSLLKEKFPELVVVTDIALDPYNSDGHDGIVDHSTGRILNDQTVEVLCQQALCHAEAGADIVSPSDMMDGRVGAIRDALDSCGHIDTSILSYTAKYASAYYGPFRTALDSDPRFGDKSTYQMDPANYREALLEAETDAAEGADMLMVKPAGPYLDVIRLLRDNTSLPIAAYQVSGEYAMIKAACERGWLDERKVVLESLLSIRRAGADMILTYFARQAAQYLNE
mmetsp:Transcript_20022/g.34420  ORF Transcript_20022/g.34420 Transcript_20022/m.34420 type:complete len:418 (-) Transcript_20022:480-1733(-)|eukprot:CAMPEP_0196660200 /NCGR_PEP_ID=MMETSP1086-20130531/38629_1 /TAXON_ID=77921 /ORGANISM="Cyanoptyche  gloeocystis , Strain SAG4.97" /LENGTH=417 /DNA_ID=CAMNT_0041994499 /DNA_START=49 /DNA_END=1302 /DNA_ORIENTATION=+